MPRSIGEGTLKNRLRRERRFVTFGVGDREHTISHFSARFSWRGRFPFSAQGAFVIIHSAQSGLSPLLTVSSLSLSFFFFFFLFLIWMQDLETRNIRRGCSLCATLCKDISEQTPPTRNRLASMYEGLCTTY